MREAYYVASNILLDRFTRAVSWITWTLDYLDRQLGMSARHLFRVFLLVNAFLSSVGGGVLAASGAVGTAAASGGEGTVGGPGGVGGEAPPTVTLGRTLKVIGKRLNTTGGLVEFYGGIPFAKPPVGKLRLKRPVLLDPSSPSLDSDGEFAARYPGGVVNATSFGLSCLQAGLPLSEVSEDCLTVNVWRPAAGSVAPGTKLPVMVWIYGGAFIGGASSLFDGSGLVARSLTRGTPIILASLNYRVGPLGFPPGLSAKQAKILNLGLYDQLTALQWIQRNIERFGGDQGKVTVFGESAGGTSIMFLLTDPEGRLVRADGGKEGGGVTGAIVESAAYPLVYPPEREQSAWNAFVDGIGSCGKNVTAATAAGGASSLDLECVLAAKTEELYASFLTLPGFVTTSPFQPVIDTVSKDSLIPDRPSILLQNLGSKSSKARKIPVMIGANLDEGTVFSSQTISSDEEIEQLLLGATSPPTVEPAVQKAYVEGLVDIYPSDPAFNSPYGTGNETFGLSPFWKKYNSLWGDLLFHSGRRLTSRKLSSFGYPTWTYHFVDPNAGAVLVGFPLPYLGVFHTTEIPFLTNERGLVNPSTETLSRTMQDYWISFALKGTPNDGHGNVNRPNWPAYKSGPGLGLGSMLELNGTSSRVVRDDYRVKEIDYLLARQDVLHR